MERKFYFAEDLEELTGLPSSTYRYWASVGQGPRSFLLGVGGCGRSMSSTSGWPRKNGRQRPANDPRRTARRGPGGWEWGFRSRL